MKTSNTVLACCLALLCACDDAGESLSSMISQPRILAVQAEPPVVSLGQNTLLVPLIAGLAQTDQVTLSLRACDPWHIITNPAADCGPGDSLVLEPESAMNGDGAHLLSTNVPGCCLKHVGTEGFDLNP